MNESFSRRGFLGRAPALAFGAAVGLSTPALAQTPIKRIGGPRLKTSLNAYSFTKLLNDNIKGRGKGISLLELLDYCAEQNFDGVDPTGYFFPGYPKVPSDKYVNDLKKRALNLGLGISGTGIRNDFAAASKESRAADVKHAKEWVEVAARLGAPVLRVFAGKVIEGQTWETQAGWMADALRECAEHGQKFGVVIGLQNHGDMLKTGEEVLKVFKLVGSEWIGSIVDTGYFVTPDPYKDMAEVTPYAVNWQVKEFVDGQKFQVKTDLKRIVKIALDGGYRGYIPIETLGKAGGASYDPRVKVAQLLKELREAMQQAG